MESTLTIPFVVKPKPQGVWDLLWYVDEALGSLSQVRDYADEITRNVNHVFGKTTAAKFKPLVELVPASFFDDIPGAMDDDPLPQNHHYSIRLRPGTHGSATRTAVDEYTAHMGVPSLDVLSVRNSATTAHELGHCFGLARGEYYRVTTLRDLSGVLPRLNNQDGIGEFWDDHQLVLPDPMRGWTIIENGTWRIPNIIAWLEYAKFCPLSSFIINRRSDLDAYPLNPTWCFAPEQWDGQFISVTIETEPGATVLIYYVAQTTVTQSLVTPAETKTADASGRVTFPWGGGPFIVSQGNLARMFKVRSADGKRIGGRWLTGFCLQAGKIMPNGGADGDFRYHGALKINLN